MTALLDWLFGGRPGLAAYVHLSTGRTVRGPYAGGHVLAGPLLWDVTGTDWRRIS
jgi:hypothetical protein